MRKLTPAAQVAKLIRVHLKSHEIKAKVTSKNYSMGCSITVTLTDELPATVNLIKDYCGQYQQGYFDGMQDSYMANNRRDDIPQVKYVFVNTEFSPILKASAWKFIREYWQDYNVSDPDYRNAGRFYDGVNYGDTKIHTTLTNEGPFWTRTKQRVRVVQ